MRKKRQFKAGRCYHLVSRIAHRAFFFDEEEKNRFVELLPLMPAYRLPSARRFCRAVETRTDARTREGENRT